MYSRQLVNWGGSYTVRVAIYKYKRTSFIVLSLREGVSLLVWLHMYRWCDAIITLQMIVTGGRVCTKREDTGVRGGEARQVLRMPTWRLRSRMIQFRKGDCAKAETNAL